MTKLAALMILCATLASAQESQLAPPLEVVEWFNSEPVTLEELRGKVVLLDFWATWCGPCVAAMPKIHALAEEMQPARFAVVLAHARTTRARPQPGHPSGTVPAETVLPEFIDRRRITLPVAVVSAEDFREYGVRAIPRYVLLDAHGRIRYKSVRMPSKELIRELME